MIWSLIVLIAVWLGYEILDPLAPEIIDPVTLLAISIPFGCTAMSWIFLLARAVYPLSWFQGTLIPIIIAGFLTAIRMVFGMTRPPRKIWRLTKGFGVTMGSCFVLFFIGCGTRHSD